MSMSDELNRLDELRQRGVLSEEEFARAKARVLDGLPGRVTAPTGAPGVDALNGFRRSRSDRWLGGVCGGLARVTGLESWVWRLLITLLVVFGGVGLLVYVLLWIFVPSE
jgi:phage shock protein C